MIYTILYDTKSYSMITYHNIVSNHMINAMQYCTCILWYDTILLKLTMNNIIMFLIVIWIYIYCIIQSDVIWNYMILYYAIFYIKVSLTSCFLYITYALTCLFSITQHLKIHQNCLNQETSFWTLILNCIENHHFCKKITLINMQNIKNSPNVGGINTIVKQNKGTNCKLGVKRSKSYHVTKR